MTNRTTPYALDHARLIHHLRVLADDAETAGRGSDTTGMQRARMYLRECLGDIGLEPVFPAYEQFFVFEGTDRKPTQGVNLIGRLRGRVHPEIYLTISAHYDHLGHEDRSREGTFSGADDNASGVSALLEVARAIAADGPRCTLVFCLFDGEEAGFKGSTAFVERAAIPHDRVALEINVDMIGRSDEGLLWVAGTHQSPWLAPHVNAIAGAVDVPLTIGHDRFSLRPGENWLKASDHAAFHAAGLPWLHFGVSNHDDTHETSDEVESIDERFLIEAAEAVYVAVRRFDEVGDKLLAARDR